MALRRLSRRWARDLTPALARTLDAPAGGEQERQGRDPPRPSVLSWSKHGAAMAGRTRFGKLEANGVVAGTPLL